jgi:alcohol dehydrogenase, propanol-preferring
MQAAVLTNFGQALSLQDMPVPVPGEDEVLLKVECCGVCHSDLHIIDGDLPGFRVGTKPMLIPGHEVIGRVVQCGPGVSHLHIGDRVGVAWKYSACGKCEQCQEGYENLCAQGGVTGMTVDGGYAQFMKARASHALLIPESLRSDEAAPLLCAGVTSYRALKNAGTGAGQRVAVFGVGGLGHLAVQIARAMGAEVLALDIGEDKLALARQLGAVQAFDAANPESLKAIRRLGGVHVAIVTSAARAAYDAALKCLRPTGTLSVVGLPHEPLQVPALALVGGETRIVGSAVGTREDIREVLALAAKGQVKCHIHTRPLAQANAVLDEMRRGAIQGRIVLDLQA